MAHSSVITPAQTEESIMYFVNYASTSLVPVNAKTLTAAKRAATQNCIFQGQTVRVFEGASEESAQLVAYRAADPINMSVKGQWVAA